MTQLSAVAQDARREGAGSQEAAPRLAPPVAASGWTDLPRLAVVALQFGLLVVVVRWFELEGASFGDVIVLAWVGFLIHHFLPARLRLPFFAALSVASIPLAVGLKTGVYVVAFGLLLIAVCHLPWSLRVRLVLLAILGGVLVELRIGLLNPLPNKVAWVVLGSMFMFRLIIYLYDLRHKAAPFSLSHATAYFFLLPNVCFPLFPLVDYKTFCTTYYNDAPLRIYQRGLRWMLRGLLHLLLYRLLYQFAQVDPFDVTDLGGVAQFMVTTYLLYLRVSGQFHLIIGLLHLFGFNLPETHHLYFLSSSFTDLWRRINIYWKDFIQKIFFYPAYFRLKRLGPTKALVLATVVAFFFTWLLHVYQFLWIRGSILFTWQDALFWWTLAVLVLATTLWEAKRGRQRALHRIQRTLRSDLGLALRTIGTFATMSVLWTFWSSESMDELSWLLHAATHVTLSSVLAILAGMVGLGTAAILFGRSSAVRTESSQGTARSSDRFVLWHSAALVGAGTCVILLLGALPSLSAIRDTTFGEVALSIKQDRLNQTDLSALRRGYYEELDVTREDVRIRAAVEPVAWMRTLKKPLVEPTHDFMLHKPIPIVSQRARGKTITTNRWGMRGRDFEQKKAPGVFRIAILGSSTENGWGIGDDDILDKLLEDRLNAEDKNDRIRKVEVLNFSVEGYGSIQKLMLLERKALAFDPDLVVYVTYLAEPERTADTLGQAVNENLEVPEPFRESVNQIFKKARVDRSMTRKRIERRIKSYMLPLIGEVFQQFADQCRQHHVQGCFVYRPDATESPRLQGARRRELLALAENTGLPVLDLSACYEGVSDRGSLMVAPARAYDLHTLKREEADDHPNELGHRLMAEEFYKVLQTPEGKALLKRPER